MNPENRLLGPIAACLALVRIWSLWLALVCTPAVAQITLTTQPQPTMANYPGMRVQVGIGANIPPNTAYAIQWQKDGVNLTNSPHYQGAVTVGVDAPASGSSAVFVHALIIIPDLQVSDTGNYRAILYAGGLSATSAISKIAPLSFTPRKPVVRLAANDASVPAGTSFVTFRTQITASPDCSYQVFKDNIPFSDDTEAKRHGFYGVKGNVTADGDSFFDFVVSPVTAESAGVYKMMITGPAGSATTRDIRLSLVPGTAPVITSQPNPVAIGSPGSNLKVTGFAATGNPAPTYYFAKDGGPLQLLATAELNFAYLLPSDTGIYSIVASNSVSTVTFNPVTVSTTPPTTQVHVPTPVASIGSVDQLRGAVLKANVYFGVDDHPNPNTYELQFSATGNSFTIPPGGYLPAQTVNYALDLTGTYGKDAYGSPVPTLNVSGFKAENGELVTAHFYLFSDDNHLDVWYDAPAKLIHHFSYYTWSNLATPSAGPTITLNPASTSVITGSRAAFQVFATGTPPLSYQWQKNNVDLPGETNRTLTIASTAAANAGSYRVKVINGSGGFKFSTAATLSLNAALPPVFNRHPQSYDYYEGEPAALQIGIGIPNGTGGPIYPQSIPATIRWERDGVPVKTVLGPINTIESSIGLGVKDGAWNYITKQEAGTYVAFASVLGSETNSTPAFVRVVNDQDAPIFRAYNTTYNLTNSAGAVLMAEVVGTQDPDQLGTLRLNRVAYQWKHEGVPIPGANLPYYQIRSMDAAQAGLYTVVATGLSGASTESGPIAVNLVDPCVPPANDAALRGSVYYLSPKADTAPWPSGVVALQFGATGNTYEVPATASHPGFSGTWSSQTFGTTYQVTLNGFTFRDGKTSAVYFNISCSNGGTLFTLSQGVSPFAFLSGAASQRPPAAQTPAPVISTPPSALTVASGQPASFTVSASVADGSLITYQWKKSGIPIPGMTSSTLSLGTVNASHAGTYSVDVTANGQTVGSTSALLTVTTAVQPTAPVLTIAPFSGGKIEFNYVTSPGVTYFIERADSVAATTWTLVQSVVGDGAAKQAALDVAGTSGFFRIRVGP